MRLVFASALLMVAMATAFAQVIPEDEVVLPLEARTCNLPNAPMRVPPDADFETLARAKPAVRAFQQDMAEYRGCLDKALASDSISDGNRLALDRAYNYSVDMEERIAEQFNVAVRNYKARQAQAEDAPD